MREFYETARHLEVERAMVERVAEEWRCNAVKLPRAYPVDWALGSKRAPRAFVECKDRSSYGWEFFDRVGGVMLSAHKWAAARSLSEATLVPFVFVVQVKGGALWYHRARDWSHDGVFVGGRHDRDDPADVEPCILLRSARFALVSAAPDNSEITSEMIQWA